MAHWTRREFGFESRVQWHLHGMYLQYMTISSKNLDSFYITYHLDSQRVSNKKAKKN